MVLDMGWSYAAGAARPESCAVIYLIFMVLDMELDVSMESSADVPHGWQLRLVAGGMSLL